MQRAASLLAKIDAVPLYNLLVVEGEDAATLSELTALLMARPSTALVQGISDGYLHCTAIAETTKTVVVKAQGRGHYMPLWYKRSNWDPPRPLAEFRVIILAYDIQPALWSTELAHEFVKIANGQIKFLKTTSRL